MTTDDVRTLTTQVLRFNNIIPLKQQTIEDFIDKTSNYLKKVESKSTNLIRIKSVRLYKDRFNSQSQ
jgi:spore coat polysaccharide biosynthesis predicted glycosyltransferase SpsG